MRTILLSSVSALLLLLSGCRSERFEAQHSTVTASALPAVGLPHPALNDIPRLLPTPTLPAAPTKKPSFIGRIVGAGKQKNVGNVTYNIVVEDRSKSKTDSHDKQQEKTKIVAPVKQKDQSVIKQKDRSTTKNKTKQKDQRSQSTGLLATTGQQIGVAIVVVLAAIGLFLLLKNKK